jgi:hypothetical protein
MSTAETDKQAADDGTGSGDASSAGSTLTVTDNRTGKTYELARCGRWICARSRPTRRTSA